MRRVGEDLIGSGVGGVAVAVVVAIGVMVEGGGGGDEGGGLGGRAGRGRGEQRRGRRGQLLLEGPLVLGDVGLGVPVVEVPRAPVHQPPPRLRQRRILRRVSRRRPAPHSSS